MANDKDYIEVRITTTGNEETKDILIAQLTDLGYEGFEEERNLLKAFIQERNFNEAMIKLLMSQHGVIYSSSVIEYKNWNEVWESGFEPVVVEDFCVIRADFHQPVLDVPYEIVITPKMSFGTGHHATTFLMIAAMKDLGINGKKIFDFGTGTGVLAILAEKMGAVSVEAIDNDDWSIENGHENLKRNESTKVLLYKSDKIPSEKKFDIILANINRNVILDQLEQIKLSAVPAGVVVLSGLLEGDEEVIVKHAEKNNLTFLSKTMRNSWICLQFVNAED